MTDCNLLGLGDWIPSSVVTFLRNEESVHKRRGVRTHSKSVRVPISVFGLKRRDSLTSILVNLGLRSFDTVLANATFSFVRLWSSCNNHSYSCAAVQFLDLFLLL